jgi:hypothetical protein
MILDDATGADAELQVGAVAVRESRTLLKTFRDGGAPVSILVSSAAIRGVRE